MTKQETKQWLIEARQKLQEAKDDFKAGHEYSARLAIKHWTKKIGVLESDLETMRKAEQKELFG